MIKSVYWTSCYIYNESIFIPYGFAPLLKEDDFIYGICATHDIIDWQKLKDMAEVLEDLYKKVEVENSLILG